MKSAPRVVLTVSVLLVAGAVAQACGGSGSSDANGAGAGAGGGSGPGGGNGGTGAAAAAGKSGASAAGTSGKGGSGTAGGTGGSAGSGGGSGAAGKAGAGGNGGASSGASGAGGAGGNGAGGNGGGAAGGPSCTPPKIACAGACVDTTADPTSCGSCGKACGVGEQCCSSLCVGTGSCSFSITKVSPANGWQNGGDFLTVTGKGFTPGTRVYLGDGRAAAWVKDATTIVVQTPPHPVGTVDVKIVSPTATAVLKNAFQYAGNGVDLPWQQKPMQAVRGENPGVAVMMNGTVLIAGGTVVPDKPDMALATAEIFDRPTDKVTQSKNAMGTPRWQNAAVTLLSGKVLVVGGACYQDLSGCNGSPTIADLFDPSTSTFAPTSKPLNLGRAYVRASLLADGRVLVASANDGSVEIYDPVADSFKQIPHAKRHTFGFIVRLRDGRTMFGGADEASVPGFGTDVEIFDPDTDTFVATGPMTHPRAMLTAHTLPDGRVIVIGGTNKSAGAVTDPQATIETWDPLTGVWTVAPYALSAGRAWHASALIRDGSILVLGGYPVSGSCMPTATAEQLDPVKNTVVPFGTLPNPNTEWNAVTLLDGSVLAVGGGACGTTSALPDLDFLPGKM